MNAGVLIGIVSAVGRTQRGNDYVYLIGASIGFGKSSGPLSSVALPIPMGAWFPHWVLLQWVHDAE